MPEKMTGTLTSSILKSVHTSISPIFLDKLCSVATCEYSEPLLLENYIHIVALVPDLWRVSFHSAIEFLYHTSTIELLPLQILIKGFYPSFKASVPCWEIVISLVAAMARKFMQGRHPGRYLQPERSLIQAKLAERSRPYIHI